MLEIALCGFLSVVCMVLLVVLFTKKTLYTKINNFYLEDEGKQVKKENVSAIWTLLVLGLIAGLIASLIILFINIDNSINVEQFTEVNINTPESNGDMPKVNINMATPKELQTLEGIGPGKANAIIKYRDVKPFDSVYELINVDGIGEQTLHEIIDDVTVGDGG